MYEICLEGCPDYVCRVSGFVFSDVARAIAAYVAFSNKFQWGGYFTHCELVEKSMLDTKKEVEEEEVVPTASTWEL